MAEDYYGILGVQPNAAPQDIKKAFRAIARECHPDVAGDDPTAEARFKSAKQAYETLCDAKKRARYDRRRNRKKSGHPGSGSFFDAFYRQTGEVNQDRGFSRRTRTRTRDRQADPKNKLNLDDLFNDFGEFGFGPGGRQERGQSARQSSTEQGGGQPTAGGDVHIDLDVPARIAQNGGTITAVYYRLKREDSWTQGSSDPGIVRVQDIADVRLTAGTRDGEVMRENGLGDAGAYGGPYGNLLVTIRVVPTTSTNRPRTTPWNTGAAAARATGGSGSNRSSPPPPTSAARPSGSASDRIRTSTQNKPTSSRIPTGGPASSEAKAPSGRVRVNPGAAPGEPVDAPGATGARPRASGAQSRPRPRATRTRTETQDVAQPTTLDISVVEALLGGRVDLKTPQGTVRLTIPAGTSSGSRMRLRGKGPAGPDGTPTDLYLEVRIVVPRGIDEESQALIRRFSELNPGSPRD